MSGSSGPQIDGASATTSETPEPAAPAVAALVSAVLPPIDPAAMPAIGPDPPTVTLTIPLVKNDSCAPNDCAQNGPVLDASGGPVTVSVGVVGDSGLTITKVALQYELSGTDVWTTLITPSTSSSPGTYTLPLSYGSFSPDGEDATGVYDVQAVVTYDDGGEVQVVDSAVVSDVVVVDDYAGDTYVGLESPPSTDLAGTVDLTANDSTYGLSTGVPDSVTFQYFSASTGSWTTIVDAGTGNSSIGPKTTTTINFRGKPVTVDVANVYGLDEYVIAFNTKALSDGVYELRVQGTDSEGTVYISNIVSILVDNTPPSVTLASPGASLSGIVALSASAQDAGSGVAEVQFEVAPSGSGDWSTIATESSEPYSISFDTRGLLNGLYDLRAVATDAAGNVADSLVLSGISITNATVPLNPDNLSITDYVVPATNVSLLGAIAGSSDDETWAYGFTTAPPAIVDGTALTYTEPAGDEQLVLLEYTDATGWQIVDVLRDAHGNPYEFISTVSSPAVSGAMTASGEAWIAVEQVLGQGSQLELFHREPGGEFLLDSADSAILQPLTGGAVNAPTLSVGEDDGTTYGVALDTDQTSGSSVLNGETVLTALTYGVLLNGAWSVQTAGVPSDYVAASGDAVTLEAISPAGPGTGWGLFEVKHQGIQTGPLYLGSFTPSGWDYVAATGLDALDLTGPFAPITSAAVQPLALSYDADGVWISASVSGLGTGSNDVVALYDPTTGHVTASWCGTAVLNLSKGCGEPLDANHPATIPDAVFSTAAGVVAVGLGSGFIDVYAYGSWTSVAAPGFGPESGGTQELFTGANAGWLSGANSLGLISAVPLPSPLAAWPEANENTLMSVALAPAGAGIGTTGALAVGLDGAALHYDATAGWIVDPVPAEAQGVDLFAVAFDGPSSAVAVGTFGTILDWNGSVWSEDPQSVSLTQSQLNAVAFASDGEGWAVGTGGTILHFDGTAWSLEQIESEDSGDDITSVTVAGGQVYAVADGILITRASDGTWQRVDSSLLPSSLPPGSLTLVSGLPDGGLVAAGQAVVITRQNASSAFEYSDQPIDGNAVALAAFRDPATGQVEAFVSVAPVFASGGAPEFPSGDGELLVQTSSGWEDLSRAQYPASSTSALPEDGAPEPDPVLAIAASADGSAAWVVGGYAGTLTAAGLGSGALSLEQIPAGWQTSSIWRYDAGGSATAPSLLAPAQVVIPAQPGVVSFAFFSSPMCQSECAEVTDAQPDANLEGAAAEISAFAQQPGGPAFAVLGGNAVGPMDPNAYASGNGAVDLANIQRYLSGLDGVPLYAAYGPLDAIPTSADPAAPWSEAFAQEPAPFGLGAVPAGITSLSAGGASGSVNLYYSFDVTQNGGTLMVIVLDNSAGSLEASASGQTAWLQAQLAAGNAAGLPMVVFCAEPLNSSIDGHAIDGDAVAALLASAGVLAVFTTAGATSELDAESMVPYNASSGAPQLPEYQGASLGYQLPQNNGVLWYFASVDTVGRVVTVQGIPVLQSLALEPLDGLTVARSSTLSFRAVGARPPGTLAPGTNPGYENYVTIPASSCSGCIAPSYAFKSSISGIGNFVQPAGPGSLLPLLNPNGDPIASSSSGLFCAFNAGTTIVSITSGLLTASLPVTVEPGGFGQPCGTVNFPPDIIIQTVPGGTVIGQTQSTPPSAPVSPPPPPPVYQVTLPAITLPPAPGITPTPASVARQPALPVLPAQVAPITQTPAIVQPAATVVVAVVVPPIAPPITPVPPGGATAPAQSTAKREERARKHASQSAFSIRPAGTTASAWFYGAVALTGLIAILLAAEGLSGLRPERAKLAWEPVHTRGRRRTRRR